jgi:hypothetical protein
MKTLHESSKNMRKALGLGLLGLLLSVVPTGQAHAAASITDITNLPADYVITGQSNPFGNYLQVNETYSANTRFHYPSVFGDQIGLLTDNKVYWDKVITFDNALVDNVMTLDFTILNNTGGNWTDYHLEFWDPTFTTRLTYLSMLSASSNQLGNFLLTTNAKGYGSDPSQAGSVMSWWEAFPGQVHEAGQWGHYTVSGNLSLITNLDAGSFGIRQVATIPEPGSLAMIGVGLAGLLGFRKVNRNAKSA